jgi:hypothetical protein
LISLQASGEFMMTAVRWAAKIEVPSHAARGVLLRPGDEICPGQVRVRFANRFSRARGGKLEE